METLIARGHDVTLYEKSGSLGGNVVRAARPLSRLTCRTTSNGCVTQQRNASKGARVLLNTEATKEILDLENYDALVLAVGSDPIIPGNIPGIDKPHVFWAPDAEENISKTGQKIVVVGGGGVGFESGLEFAGLGKEVTLIEMLEEHSAKIKLQMSAGSVSRELLTIFEKKGIPCFTALHWPERTTA